MSDTAKISDLVQKAQDALEADDKHAAKRFALQAIVGASNAKDNFLTDVRTTVTDQQLADWYGGCSFVMEKINENLTAIRCFYTATVFDPHWTSYNHLSVAVILLTKLIFMKDIVELNRNLKTIMALLSDMDKLAKLAERRKRWPVCVAIDGDINLIFRCLMDNGLIPGELTAQPGRKEAMSRTARCYLQLNMHLDVRRLCRTILQYTCDYDNSEAFEIWARSLYATGNYDIALEKNECALKYCQDDGDRQRLERFQDQIQQKLDELTVSHCEAEDESWLEGTNITSTVSSRCPSPSSSRQKKRHKRPKAKDRSGLCTPKLQTLKDNKRQNNAQVNSIELAARLECLKLKGTDNNHSRRRNRRSRTASGSSCASLTSKSSDWTETDYSASDSDSENDYVSTCYSSAEGTTDSEEDTTENNDSFGENNWDFYEQSCRFYEQANHIPGYFAKSVMDERLIKFGIDLNMSFLNQLEHKNHDRDPFYESFMSEEELRQKLIMNPKKYIRCVIQIGGAHEALCYPVESGTKIDVIEISGRSKIGQCFNEDEVVVEILDNQEKKGKRFGKVLGILNRQRHKGIKHPVFICTLDEMESHLVRPLCKTVPKLHIMNREITKRFNTERKRRYKIEVYEYDERAGILCNPQVITINPAETRSQIYLVAFIHWGNRHIYPRGAIIKKLSGGKNMRTSMMVLNLQHEVPTLYKKETINIVSSMISRNIDEPSASLLQGRQDLTDLNTFTIDPPESKDLDDALSIQKTEAGFKVGVHISDVTAYIPKDSALDAEMKQRATTFYPGRRPSNSIPESGISNHDIDRPRNMIPEPLSTNICSLVPGRKRLTISVFFHLTDGGRRVQTQGRDFEIQKSFIKSRRQLSYSQAQQMIVATSTETHDQITKDVRSLFKLAARIRKIRLGNSMFAMDLDWEESRFHDTESDTAEAHYLVEEFMVMANKKIANILLAIPSCKHCVPLRCQPPPSQEHIDQFFKRNEHYIDIVVRLQDKQIGPKKASFDACLSEGSKQNIVLLHSVWESISASPKNAAKYLRNDDLHPIQLSLYQQWISIQERAGYRCSGGIVGEEDGKHYSLDMFPYTHFTSPIRRYNDIIVHRLIHAAIFDKEIPPYTKEEVEKICIHSNSVTKRAKDYQKCCKSLQQALELKENPQTVVCFVDEVNDKGITLCAPVLKYASKQNRELTFNLLDMGYRPDVFQDPETSWGMVKAVWRKRLYNFHVRPLQGNDNSSEKKLNPNKRLVYVPMFQWAKMLKCSVDGRLRDLEAIVKSVKVCSRNYGCDDVSTECENPLRIQPNTKFSITYSRGQQVEIQMTASPYNGVLAPKLMLYNMTNNVKFCLQHTEDPVRYLYHYVTRPTCDKYESVDQYVQRWLPLILMEAATGITRNEESCCINDHVVRLSPGRNRGKFALGLAECEVRNIELAGTLSDEDDDEEENGQAGSYDWLCLKTRIPCSGRENLLKKKDSEVLDNTWIGHAEITKVKKSTETKPGGKLTVFFRLHELAPSLPSTIQQSLADQRFSIEILPKTEVDRRTESYIKKLPLVPNSLAMKIALNRPIHQLESNRLGMAEVTERDLHYEEFTDDDGVLWRPLPPNNEKQQEAINKAMKSRFCLIQGPPGTGKTYTGIKLMYLFDRINGMLHREGKPRKQVLFCGPSNKSVDLVARWMYYRMQPKFRPNFVRVYGKSIEAMDFPIPGRSFLSKKSTKTLQVSADLYPVALHHIIRQKGKKNSEEIRAMDRLFKDTGYMPNPEKVKEYVHLIREASIDEIRTRDVILCTTAVGANPKILKAATVYQVIIDEAGMCPEPHCLVPIIATNAEQVVLLGDHKQLRPIIMCKAAAELGMETSLFERYATSKSANVPFTMLDTQYRMDFEICRFPSKRFYENKLMTDVKYYGHAKLWPRDMKGTYPHVFVHVEGEEKILTVSTEEGNEKSRSNDAEIEQVARIYKYFLDEQYGSVQILSQYNAQCSEIRRKLKEMNINFNNENVTTVVSSQGGEWDYVIFSTVRSLPEYMIEKNPTLGWCKHNLGFITDRNQINVALTRARRGIVIIGNQNLLKCDYVWKRLLQHYDERGCIKTPDKFPPQFRRARLAKMKGNIRKSELRYGEHAKFIKGEATSFDGPVDEDEGRPTGSRV